jgi:Mor family transcriptional regulator
LEDKGDIVEQMLDLVREKTALDEANAKEVEAALRQRFGGQRIYVPRWRAHMNAMQKKALYEDGVSNAPEEEVTRKHKISRATLYRHLKRFGP